MENTYLGSPTEIAVWSDQKEEKKQEYQRDAVDSHRIREGGIILIGARALLIKDKKTPNVEDVCHCFLLCVQPESQNGLVVPFLLDISLQ